MQHCCPPPALRQPVARSADYRAGHLQNRYPGRRQGNGRHHLKPSLTKIAEPVTANNRGRAVLSAVVALVNRIGGLLHRERVTGYCAIVLAAELVMAAFYVAGTYGLKVQVKPRTPDFAAVCGV